MGTWWDKIVTNCILHCIDPQPYCIFIALNPNRILCCRLGIVSRVNIISPRDARNGMPSKNSNLISVVFAQRLAQVMLTKNFPE